MTKKCLGTAFKSSIPVLFGYITLGIAYGILLTGSGYPWWLATLSGVIVFTGAGQMLAVGLFAAGTPLTAIILSELLISVRHVVYGLTLITKYKGAGKWKPYLVFAITDETYSILTTTDFDDEKERFNFYGLLSFFNQCYWIMGSTLGGLLGTVIPFDLSGVDFALTALFIVLTIEQIQKTKDVVSPIAGAVTTVIAIILWKLGLIASTNILMIAIVLGIAVIFAIKYRKNNLQDNNL